MRLGCYMSLILSKPVEARGSFGSEGLCICPLDPFEFDINISVLSSDDHLVHINRYCFRPIAHCHGERIESVIVPEAPTIPCDPGELIAELVVQLLLWG